MHQHNSLDSTVTVPAHWSADQALIVALLLSDISDAIWAAYRPKMEKRLRRANELTHGAPVSPPRPK